MGHLGPFLVRKKAKRLRQKKFIVIFNYKIGEQGPLSSYKPSQKEKTKQIPKRKIERS